MTMDAPDHNIDDGVTLGYRSGRSPADAILRLGNEARLRRGTILYADSTIGDRLATGHHVVVREQCRLGDDVSVWSNSVVDYGCQLGDRVKIHTNCYVAQHSRLDEGAFLAPGVSFANDLYPGRQDSAERMAGPWIGAGAQLGVNVTVLPYVHIGAGTIVGAGSTVTRDLPAGVVAFGSPARPIRDVEEVGALADVLAPDPERPQGLARSRVSP